MLHRERRFYSEHLLLQTVVSETITTVALLVFFIGASLSEPHIDELNVCNLYIIIIIIIIIMVRPSPARRYRDCTGVRDIFQYDLEAA